MTLRDYFAAAALQGWLASYPERDTPHPAMNEQICLSCNLSQVAISPNRDTPKECGHCGEFNCLWVANQEE